jgi:hypothetical protein
MTHTKIYGCLGPGREKEGHFEPSKMKSSLLKPASAPSSNTSFLYSENILRAH